MEQAQRRDLVEVDVVAEGRQQWWSGMVCQDWTQCKQGLVAAGETRAQKIVHVTVLGGDSVHEVVKRVEDIIGRDKWSVFHLEVIEQDQRR